MKPKITNPILSALLLLLIGAGCKDNDDTLEESKMSTIILEYIQAT